MVISETVTLCLNMLVFKYTRRRNLPFFIWMLSVHSQTKYACFKLNSLLVIPDKNVIRLANKQELKVEPKVMAVLHYIVDNHGRVVSLDEIIEHVWQGRATSNHSVHRCISAIRKLLNECLGEAEYIQSFSKKGYQITLTPIFVEADITTKESPPLLAVWKLALLALFVFTLAFSYQLLAPKFVQKEGNKLKTAFSSIEAFTADAGYEINPEPNPTNNVVAFIKYKEGDHQLNLRLNDGQEWQLTSQQATWKDLVWSDDGTKLAASTLLVSGTGGKVVIHIFDIDLSGKVVNAHQQIKFSGLLDKLSWSGNNKLVFIGRKVFNEKTRLYEVDLGDQAISKLAELDPKKQPAEIHIKHGKTALLSHHERHMDIELIGEQGQQLALWHTLYSFASISWLPELNGVLLLADNKLFVLSLEQDDQEISFLSQDIIVRPRFTHDGQKLMLTKGRNNYDIWHSDSLQDQQLTDSSFDELMAIYNHAGDQFAYASQRQQGHFQVWLYDGKKHKALTSFQSPGMVANLIWAEDDQNLFYATRGKIYQYSLKHKRQSVVIDKKGYTFPLAYDNASDTLFYSEQKEHIYELWTKNLVTGQAIYTGIKGVISASRIKNKLLFQKIMEPGLYQIPINKAYDSPTLLDENFPVNALFHYADSQNLYYSVLEDNTQSNLFIYDFELKQSQLFWQKDSPKTWISSHHPKTGTLLYKSLNGGSDIITLK